MEGLQGDGPVIPRSNLGKRSQNDTKDAPPTDFERGRGTTTKLRIVPDSSGSP